MEKRLRLAVIKLDFQPLEYLRLEAVDEIARALRARKTIPPITVYSDGKEYWLYDGFHRVNAALKVGRKTLLAEVVPGTLADIQEEWNRGLEVIKNDNRRWGPG